MAATGTKKKKGSKLTRGERRRVRQLVACLILFGVVFLGRGVNAAPFHQLSETVGTMVRSDTDFQQVFARMGQSFSEGEPAVETFRTLWSGIFTREEETEGQKQASAGPAREETQNADKAEHQEGAGEAGGDGETS